MKLDVFFLLLKKRRKAGVNAFLAYKILTVSEKGLLMQHYAFDLLENLTGKELVWPISNPCLCQMLCNVRVTDIAAWGTLLRQLSQISIWKGTRESRSVLRAVNALETILDYAYGKHIRTLVKLVNCMLISAKT